MADTKSSNGAAGKPAKAPDKAPAKAPEKTPEKAAAAVAAPAAPRLMPAQQAEVNRRLAASFGDIVNVLMRTPQYRYAFLGDLEWLVVPALASGQASVAEATDKTTGVRAPVAVVLWATVSEEVDKRLSASSAHPPRLRPDEWTSGNIPWLIEAAGEPRAASALLKNIVERRFAKTGLRSVVRGPDGKPEVRDMRAQAASPGAVAKA
jgi:hemolysin-activating ACP:hemolysin acyltransferase